MEGLCMCVHMWMQARLYMHVEPEYKLNYHSSVIIIIIFLKIKTILFMCEWLYTCMSTKCVQCQGGQKRVLGPLGFELQTVVKHPVGTGN